VNNANYPKENKSMADPTQKHLKILVIDDDPECQSTIGTYAELLEHTWESSSTFDEAKRMIENAERCGAPFAVATIDMKFTMGKYKPGKPTTALGTGILQYIKKKHPYIACIMVTAEVPHQLLDLRDEYKLDAYISKGRLDQDSLAEAINKALERVKPFPDRKDGVKILFLAANPSDTQPLKLDEEIRAIDEALLKAKFRDKFALSQHWAVRVTDLQAHLLRCEPDIVHFSGHGSQAGEIMLSKGEGQDSHPVSVGALSELFSVLKGNIRCVVLNACYSEEQARAIAGHVDCVIGMSKAIGDLPAIRFAEAFYQALAFGKNVKTAFDLGCAQINLENLGEQDTPKLLALKKNPEEIIFLQNQ
jgi:DNA-binding NarL/FixJ family response regulator